MTLLKLVQCKSTGRIAQLVERWSNKPLVLGSSPNVTTFFVLFFCFPKETHKRVFLEFPPSCIKASE